MGNSSASPRSQQRLRVFDAYRGRGRQTNALWLVYSIKMDRDLIISSDRRFVHWIVFLETDPVVNSFEFSAAKNGSVPDISIEVQLANGLVENHIVVAGFPKPGTVEAPPDGQGQAKVNKIFTDAELKPRVSLAMRWHKALTFAAGIRDRECGPIRLALVPLIRSLGSGTLSQVLKELHSFEESAVLGMMVRLAVEGHVSIDLSRSSFSYATSWSWREGEQSVVA